VTTQSSSPPDDEIEVELQERLTLENDNADVTFWMQFAPGQNYVRCLLPARYINGQVLRMNFKDLAWNEETNQAYMPRQRGAAVWPFEGGEIRGRIFGLTQDLGFRTLMEVDDNYTVPNPLSLVDKNGKKMWHKTMIESMQKGESGYSYEAHRIFIPQFDGIIVSTPNLRAVYLEYNENVFLCPNTVDPVDWEDLAPKDPSVLRIVVSGSQSHLRDVPMLKKALKWASRQKGVEIWLHGVNPAWGFAKQVPWTNNLAEYRHSLGAFDVGLAPLIPGEWNDGKSDLKALEYSMAGVMPLVSHTESYRPWWDSGLTVEPHEDAWVDRIKHLVRNRDEVPQQLEKARTYVLNERTTAANAWRWRKAIDE
jgi:hypothetical protein